MAELYEVTVEFLRDAHNVRPYVEEVLVKAEPHQDEREMAINVVRRDHPNMLALTSRVRHLGRAKT